MDHNELDNFITYGAAYFKYNSGDTDDISNITIYSACSTIDAGDVPFEVKAQDEFSYINGINVSVRLILNFVGTIMTRQLHPLK